MQLSEIKRAINESHPYLKNFFYISVAVFVFGFMVFFSVYLIPNTKVVKAEVSENSVSLGKSVLEVHIANNGMVYLQGARVLAVSGTTVLVSTSWNHMEFKWTIQTNASNYGKRHFGTSFLDSKGKSGTLNDIRVGDFISINGLLDMNSSEVVVKADVVRI
ncbi:MAG TPA: hypothetical protein VJC13_01860 [Candidatus Paceibacterota bacterium]